MISVPLNIGLLNLRKSNFSKIFLDALRPVLRIPPTVIHFLSASDQGSAEKTGLSPWLCSIIYVCSKNRIALTACRPLVKTDLVIGKLRSWANPRVGTNYYLTAKNCRRWNNFMKFYDCSYQSPRDLEFWFGINLENLGFWIEIWDWVLKIWYQGSWFEIDCGKFGIWDWF